MRRLCAALLGVLVLIGTAHAAPSKYMVTQDTMATSDTTLFKVYGQAQIDSLTTTHALSADTIRTDSLTAKNGSRVNLFGKTYADTLRSDSLTAGNVTATYFYGDGSNLTGVGSSAATSLSFSAKVNEAAGITKGQAVYISGATGQTPQVSLCDNRTAAKRQFAGLAAESKTNGQTILIRNRGELTGLNTSGTGAPGTTLTWADGDALYLTTGGNLKNVKPTSGVVQHVGNVEYAHGSSGKILITTHLVPYVSATSTEDIDLRMGEAGGVTKVAFEDSLDAVVGYVNSDGKANFYGGLDSTVIGATNKRAGSFTALTSTGLTTLGDAAGDTAQIKADYALIGNPTTPKLGMVATAPGYPGLIFQNDSTSFAAGFVGVTNANNRGSFTLGSNCYLPAGSTTPIVYRSGGSVPYMNFNSRTAAGSSALTWAMFVGAPGTQVADGAVVGGVCAIGADSLGNIRIHSTGLPDSALSVTGGISSTGGARFDKGVNVAGDINPTTDNARDLGSAATSFDSLWIHVAAVVGDMPWYDVDENGAPLNDVDAIRQIGTAGEIEPGTGRTLVDDATLPPQILVTHPDDAPARIDTLWTERQVPIDSTVTSYTVKVGEDGRATDAEPVYDVTYRTERTLVDVVEVPAHQRGDPVLSPDGKPYIDLRAAQGLTFGAVRQLADSLDVLNGRIAELEALVAGLNAKYDGLEARLAKLEER